MQQMYRNVLHSAFLETDEKFLATGEQGRPMVSAHDRIFVYIKACL